MRRFAVGCSTDSHQLYATFMSRLSHYVFMWDQDDLKAAKDAKRAELEAGGRHPSEADVLRSVSRSELALHCRRITRGTKETQAQIHRLIQAFDGDAGRDSLGVPLINSARMSEIIKSQWKHVACIQDPPGVQLYAQTGSSVKGGHRLPTYRCARGSTSLESFHLHLNRFIPGTLASDTFFQAYVLDGLACWNEDRAMAATRDEQQHPHYYNHLLRHAVNTLAEEVLSKKIIPYVGPRKWRRVRQNNHSVAGTGGFRQEEDQLSTPSQKHTEAGAIQGNKKDCGTRFSRRCRSQEEQILKQGIPAPDAPMAGPEKLLVAMQKGTSLYPGSLAEPHTFVLPSNTPGEAKLQNRSQPVAISQVPPPPPYYALPFLAPTPPFSTPYMVPSVQVPQVPGPSQVVPGSSQMMLLNMPLPSATQALTSSQSNVPYTTQQYRKRKEEREQSGSGKRKYVKKTDAIICKNCNKDRKPPAHLQYFGNWYCKESETQSYEEWRAVLEQRGYGKKKRGDAP
ncbi:hypothetical protein NQZ68_021437 [Dissostichus eleginoides]|nr:hypothetical protein NQZ68_021437 [Dissostichus eleginoides]